MNVIIIKDDANTVINEVNSVKVETNDILTKKYTKIYNTTPIWLKKVTSYFYPISHELLLT